ncbi:hypothetical protein M430DRAFT_178047 [Amorphotheca resinae ATCC 22711]|uniref:Uncharacterized protein n=1 Tax=Amorphotheca resinae ATCC 22711 TaxID=857342 RepID=A0A2T3AT86_AMORE|nr:hypothetical protein M430DRAFT_178047 [Amorphotheca resinae ATCC 22711]PSS10708.1 hypothetical protein M430DRAFT_178047 [Amorphotheca resinae ATCC 22711]
MRIDDISSFYLLLACPLGDISHHSYLIPLPFLTLLFCSVQSKSYSYFLKYSRHSCIPLHVKVPVEPAFGTMILWSLVVKKCR